MISKKEIQSKVEESVALTVSKLEGNNPSKKTQKVIKKSSKKLASLINKDLKKIAKKTEKSTKKGKKKENSKKKIELVA